jgi:hypothetical protein
MTTRIITSLIALALLGACTGSQKLIDRGIEIASGDTAQSARPAGQFPPPFCSIDR